MSTTINDVRMSHVNVFQPKPPYNNPTGEPKYSLTILVPKSNVQAKAAIDAAVQDAINAGVSKVWGGQRPPMPAICVHDGDGPRPNDGSPYSEECRGCWVFTASSKQPPFVVDAQVQPIMDPREVYSGMWGNVNVDFFAYHQAGKKGIGCGLNGIQKTRDGEPLTNRVTAEDAFKPVGQQPAYGAPQPTPNYSAQTAPGYGTPQSVPTYGQSATGYAPQPNYGQPTVDPITGKPYTPIMGL